MGVNGHATVLLMFFKETMISCLAILQKKPTKKTPKPQLFEGMFYDEYMIVHTMFVRRFLKYSTLYLFLA